MAAGILPARPRPTRDAAAGPRFCLAWVPAHPRQSRPAVETSRSDLAIGGVPAQQPDREPESGIESGGTKRAPAWVAVMIVVAQGFSRCDVAECFLNEAVGIGATVAVGARAP